jgi:hypothetical protein
VNVLNDPMAAGFIWRVVLFIFSWTMFIQLKKEGASQFWWIRMLKSARVVSMENYNYAGIVEKSRLTFRWLAIAATVILLVHGFSFYKRYDPDFLFGPKPVSFNSPNEKPALPPAIPGAGGGGAVAPGQMGAPRPREQDPPQPGAGQPGMPGQPGGYGAPGGPGGLPAPGTGGSRGMPGMR